MGSAAPEVAVDPLHQRSSCATARLSPGVYDVVGERGGIVRVSATASLLDHYLYYSYSFSRFCEIPGSCHPSHVMAWPPPRPDHGPLEPAHVLGVEEGKGGKERGE